MASWLTFDPPNAHALQPNDVMTSFLKIDLWRHTALSWLVHSGHVAPFPCPDWLWAKPPFFTTVIYLHQNDPLIAFIRKIRHDLQAILITEQSLHNIMVVTNYAAAFGRWQLS